MSTEYSETNEPPVPSSPSSAAAAAAAASTVPATATNTTTTTTTTNASTTTTTTIETETETETNSSSLGLDILNWYFLKLIKMNSCKYIIVVTWVILGLIGIIFGDELYSHTQVNYSAPTDTQAYRAKQKFETHFNYLFKSSTMILFYQTDNNIHILNPSLPFQNVTLQIRYELLNWNASYTSRSGMIVNISDYYKSIDICQNASEEDSNMYYYQTEKRQCIKSARNFFISEKNTSAFSIISHQSDISDSQRSDLLDKIDEIVDNANRRYFDQQSEKWKRINTDYTGLTALWKDSYEETTKNVKHHLYVLPLMLVIFAYTAKSWRLMVIPILSMFITFRLALVLMVPVALYMMDVSPNTTSIMTSVSLAMGIDYNLFLFVRWQEELDNYRQMKKMKGKNIDQKEKEEKEEEEEEEEDESDDEEQIIPLSVVHHALYQMLRWSGQVVIVSGCILMLSMGAYLYCDLSMLQSFGVGASVTVCCAMIAALTFTPAMLLIFPSFFIQSGWNCRCKKIVDDTNTEQLSINNYNTTATELELYSGIKKTENSEEEDEEEKGNQETTLLLPKQEKDQVSTNFNATVYEPFEISAKDKKNYMNKCWYQCGVYTTLFPFSILVIVVVYLLILPIALYCQELQIQYASVYLYPRDSSHVKVLNELETDFFGGLIGPFYLLISKRDDQYNVWNWSYVSNTSTILHEFYTNFNNTGTQIDYIKGISVLGHEFISNKSVYNTIYTSHLYHQSVDSQVSPDKTQSYFQLWLHENPYGLHCRSIVRHIRSHLSQQCKKFSYDSCTAYGRSAELVDTVSKTYEEFPITLGVTLIVIFALAGIVFRNKFLPLRLLLTIVIPFTAVYGFSILVYQHNILGWLSSAALEGSDGVHWLVPLMTLMMLFGLALDYDIFLFARINEWLLDGVPLRVAIIRGVFRTGGVITSAGIIMALAFSGLLFSNVKSINQMGLILVVGVVIDTFVIRTLLVPSILSLTNEVTWDPTWQKRVYSWFGWELPSTESDQKVIFGTQEEKD